MGPEFSVSEALPYAAVFEIHVVKSFYKATHLA